MSLSLFEALRGLRDSVAPESNINNTNEPNGNDPNSISSQKSSPLDMEMDYEDFLLAYHRDDPVALEFIKMADNKPPKTRDEYTKLRAKFAGIRASELLSKLAGNILSRSAAVHNLVEDLPNRTKAEQMERISELIEQNRAADEELNSVFSEAESKRNLLRSVLDEVTCKALGIEEG